MSVEKRKKKTCLFVVIYCSSNVRVFAKISSPRKGCSQMFEYFYIVREKVHVLAYERWGIYYNEIVKKVQSRVQYNMARFENTKPVSAF